MEEKLGDVEIIVHPYSCVMSSTRHGAWETVHEYLQKEESSFTSYAPTSSTNFNNGRLILSCPYSIGGNSHET